MLGSQITLFAAPEDPDATVAEKRNWLRHHAEPRHMVKSYMADTWQARVHWVHREEEPPLSEVLAAHPRLADLDGYVWVRITS